MKKIKGIALLSILVTYLSLTGCFSLLFSTSKAPKPSVGALTIPEENKDGASSDSSEPVRISINLGDEPASTDISDLEGNGGTETTGSEDADTPSSESAPVKERDTYGYIVLSSNDIDGSYVDADSFLDYDLIMVNFWEPWCGPCVKEMPALENLYENYQDRKFLVIGIYSTFDMKQDAKDIISQLGITYPVLEWNRGFESFETGYVPTTIFCDGSGNVLSEEPYIGSLSYSDWEQIILSYLE